MSHLRKKIENYLWEANIKICCRFNPIINKNCLEFYEYEHGKEKHLFYYLYDKNEFDSWADLNEERIEPALCVVNDTFIYAFSNLRNNNDKLTFEKTNLRKKPIWEIIEPILPSDLIFTQKFFGTCYNYKNKNVIFFGGKIFHSQ